MIPTSLKPPDIRSIRRRSRSLDAILTVSQWLHRIIHEPD